MKLLTEEKENINLINDLKIIPLNPEPDGSCRTIKNQYYKTSLANFLKTGTWGATGVITYENKHK